MDPAALALLRPAQRREDVLRALREGGIRLLEAARPGAVAVVFAETSDGVALALPIAGGAALPARAERLANAAAAALAEAAGLPHPMRAGDAEIEAAGWEGQLALRVTHTRPATVLELLPLTLEDQAGELDRVRIDAVPLPGGRPRRDGARARRALAVAGRDGSAPRRPARGGGARTRGRCGARAPRAGRLHASAVDPAIADDPLPRRRAARRMLRRLDGMGKYGGYHTEFRHLARGFAGHERALALEVGEALLRAGYLAEKPSVGQRHVSLVAARTNDIRALVERGTCDEPLRSLLA